jgi:hypothetical protein
MGNQRRNVRFQPVRSLTHLGLESIYLILSYSCITSIPRHL